MSRSAPRIPVRTLEQLVRAVTEALVKRKERAEWEAVLGNWETGQFINAHILQNQIRAERHALVYTELSRRTQISQRLLYQCAQFARRFPYLHGRANMSWSHYRLLCQIEDDAARRELQREALRRGWSPDDLEARVRQRNSLRFAASDELDPAPESGSADPAPRLLVANPGTPGLYPVVARGVEATAVDLGFKMFLPLARDVARRLKLQPGDIVRAEDDGTIARADAATKADLFTYRARDVRVVDGDTLAVTLLLPPHNEIDKKLRLRGINCPESATEAGKDAKRFAQRLLAGAETILLTTTKPDKYDRYLANVFIAPPAGSVAQLPAPDTQSAADGGVIFLNNALLENRHAVRFDGTWPEAAV